MRELLHDGNPVSFPTLMNKWPVFVSLIDYQTLTDSPQQQIFNWRIDAATVIAEASIEGANRFLGNQQPVWRIKAYICMLLAVICDLMWRLLRLIVPSSLIRIS
jgi:NADH dehydrogenase